MKKIVFLLTTALVLAGCSGRTAWTPAGMAKEDVICQQEFIDYTLPENQKKLSAGEKQAETLAGNEKYREFYQDYWRFANQTFREIAGQGNWIYSPLSAYLPLSELSYALEDGSAPQADLIRLLRENAPKEYWTKPLMRHFQGQGYLTASSIWLSKDYQPNLQFLQQNLTSDIYRLDFAAEGAAQSQMDWINRWTKGFLKEQVKAKDFQNQARLLCRLIGTAYVKTAWADDFFKEEQEIFYGADGQQPDVPFLRSVPTKMLCRFTEQYQAVRIPLKSGYMLVVLPREGETLERLLQSDALLETANGGDWREKHVVLHMPNFTASSRIELLPVLEKLGYTEIGQPNTGYANLAGKAADGSEIESFVAEILQESKIEVKKAGVEAAAYTKVEVKASGMLEEADTSELVEIFVNRPYLYVIADADGLPGFLGVNRDFSAAGQDTGQAPAAKAALLPPYQYDGTDPYLEAICRYLLKEFGDLENDGEVTIPAPVVFYTEEAGDEVQVFGNFWLFRYRLQEAVLLLQSGREMPGRFHLKKDGDGYTVAAFDQVLSGHQYAQDIQALCAEKNSSVFPSLTEHYQEHNYTGETDTAYVRKTFIERYAEKNGLAVSAYQDHGRDLVMIAPVKKLRLEDKLYLDTGQFSYLYGCGTMDFSAGMAVAAGEVPMKNRQTNFGDCEGQWGLGNRILVVYDGKKHIFEEMEQGLK